MSVESKPKCSILLYYHTMLYVCIVLLLCVNRILLENVKSSRNVAIKEMNDVSIGDLVFNLQPEQKRIVRAIERTQKQYTNSKYAVIFNTKCLQEGLLPKYLVALP